jgi:hypothetical protein
MCKCYFPLKITPWKFESKIGAAKLLNICLLRYNFERQNYNFQRNIK